MNKCVISVLLVVLINFTSGDQWPSSIMRCSRNDPNLDDCLLKAANDAVPKLVNGSLDLGVRGLDPLRFSNFSTTSHRTGISGVFELPEAQVEGIGNMKIKSFRFDKENRMFVLDVLHKQLKMSGNYKIRGKILFLNVRSYGYFETVSKNVDATHRFKLSPDKERSGFAKLTMEYTLHKLGRMSVYMEDSVLPDAAEDALNTIMNDNWRVVADALLPTIEDATNKIFEDTLGGLFERYPLDAILPLNPDVTPS